MISCGLTLSQRNRELGHHEIHPKRKSSQVLQFSLKKKMADQCYWDNFYRASPFPKTKLGHGEGYESSRFTFWIANMKDSCVFLSTNDPLSPTNISHSIVVQTKIALFLRL